MVKLKNEEFQVTLFRSIKAWGLKRKKKKKMESLLKSNKHDEEEFHSLLNSRKSSELDGGIEPKETTS